MSIIKPVADCPECLGRGWTIKDHKKCACMYRQEAIEYLGEYNVPGKVPKGLQVEKYTRDLVFEDMLLEKFRSCVKVFLLSTAMKYQHKTMRAVDILKAYVANPEGGLHPFQQLYDLDFLIINLGLDPHNNFYGETMQALIETRIQHKKFTWVNSRYAIASDTFKNAYQVDFAYFLSNPPFSTMGK